MPLPIVTDSLDSIEEGKRSVYVERDGKFYLDAEIEDVSGLKSALKKEREALKKSDEKRKEYEAQIEADRVKMEEAELAKKGLTDVKKKWDEEQLRPVAEKLSAAEARIHELTFGSQMDVMLADADVVNLKAARKQFDEYYQLNEEGKLAPKEDPTADPSKYLVGSLKKEYGFIFKGTQAAGGGAAGSGAGKPGTGGKPASKWTQEERADFINANGADAYMALLDSQMAAAGSKSKAAWHTAL